MKRVPVPIFLQNTELSIALHSAIGITRLANTIEESLALIPTSQIFGIGLVLDADEAQTGVSRGWGSIIVWGTVDLEQSEQRKKDRR